jgi:carbon storage regulator
VLVLSRKLNQAIVIGDDVRIVVVAVERDTVKLGIEAPRSIPVHRSEVYEEIQRANRGAAAGEGPPAGAKPRIAPLGRGPKPPRREGRSG